MKEEDFKRRFAAILSADVKGYSRLMSEVGREDEAQAHAAEVLKIDPGFSLEWVCKTTFFKHGGLIEEDLNALRKAGLK